jgi:methionyl-tRNA formyltransferase
MPDRLPPLRIAFVGTPGFAVPTLEHLLRSDHILVGVVTPPDRPRGRGQHLTEGPVKRLALDHNLPVLQPARISDPAFLEALRRWRVDLGVVAAYGKILTQTLLDLPRLGMINVHASLLPKYRGAAPIQRAVMAGEPETGVTIMRIVRELDAGPMLATVVQSIGPEKTSDEIEQELAFLGAALLVSVVNDIASDRVVEMPQDSSQATYAPRLTKSEGLIVWTQSAQSIHNRVRGLHPWPHAFTYLDGARYIIHRTRIEADVSHRFDSSRACAGQILAASDGKLLVNCGEGGTLAILQIQPEGRRPLEIREFLSGHHLRPGQVFTGIPNP